MDNTQLTPELQNIAAKLQSEFLSDSANLVEYKPEENAMYLTKNFADAKWIQLYGMSGVKDESRYRYRLDIATKTAYYLVEQIRVEWKAGLPTISLQANYFRGQTWGGRSEIAYGMRPDGSIGKLYEVKDEITSNYKKMQAIFASEGWTLKRDMNDWSVKIAIVMAAIAGVGAVLTVVLLLILD